MSKKRKMNFLENLLNLIRKARSLNAEALEAIRYGLMGAVVVDLFGIYYYLGAKKLGGAFLMVILVTMAMVLMLERDLPIPPKTQPKKIEKGVNKMEQIFEDNKESEKKSEEKPEKKSEEEEQPEETDIMGENELQTAEEYQKKIEGALSPF